MVGNTLDQSTLMLEIKLILLGSKSQYDMLVINSIKLSFSFSFAF